MNNRLEWVDNARGVAILLVIFFHSTTLLRYGFSPSLELNSINDAFAPFRMAILAFIAGLISSYSIRKGFREYFGGKIRTLLWPYFIWTIVNHFTTGSNYGFLDHETYISYLWYLPFLFVSYGLAYFFRNLNFLALGALALTISAIIPEDIEAAKRSFYLLGIFSLGSMTTTLYKLYFSNFSLNFISWMLIFISALAVSMMSIIGADLKYDSAWLIAVLCGIISIAKLSQMASNYSIINRLLSFFGRNSIVFYLTHFQIIFLSMNLLSNYTSLQNSVIATIISFAASVSIGAILTIISSNSNIVSYLFSFKTNK